MLALLEKAMKALRAKKRTISPHIFIEREKKGVQWTIRDYSLCNSSPGVQRKKVRFSLSATKVVKCPILIKTR
tara:strand:- start:141 stop:359 length:219 start_codon:yes stop_codon:yes gene_type:complete